MNKRKNLLLPLIALLLLGYGTWTTAHVSKLQARLARLEASHLALGRYTFDFGAAITELGRSQGRARQPGGLSSSDTAKMILFEMQQDELTRPAVASSRTRQMLIEERLSPHNSVHEITR